jgi:endonuclease-3
MSALKRSASSRISKLTTRASPYHSSVTLYEAAPTGSTSARKKRILKAECVDEIEDVVSETRLAGKLDQESGLYSSKKKTRKTSSPRKPIKQSLEVPHPAPENWRETYDMIKEMRSRITAPVDTMGCEQAQFKEQDPKVRVDSCGIAFSVFIFSTESTICDSCITHVVFTNER